MEKQRKNGPITLSIADSTELAGSPRPLISSSSSSLTPSPSPIPTASPTPSPRLPIPPDTQLLDGEFDEAEDIAKVMRVTLDKIAEKNEREESESALAQIKQAKKVLLIENSTEKSLESKVEHLARLVETETSRSGKASKRHIAELDAKLLNLKETVNEKLADQKMHIYTLEKKLKEANEGIAKILAILQPPPSSSSSSVPPPPSRSPSPRPSSPRPSSPLAPPTPVASLAPPVSPMLSSSFSFYTSTGFPQPSLRSSLRTSTSPRRSSSPPPPRRSPSPNRSSSPPPRARLSTSASSSSSSPPVSPRRVQFLPTIQQTPPHSPPSSPHIPPASPFGS